MSTITSVPCWPTSIEEGFTNERTRQDEDNNAYAIRHTVLRLREGAVPGPELDEEVRAAFVNYLETGVILQWDSDLLEFLMELSVVDEFTLELAETVSGNRHALALLERAAEVGNFLTVSGGLYRLRPELIRALRSRAEKVFGTARMKDLAAKWMSTAPDGEKEFCVLERYRYLTRVRCCIANGDNMMALGLLEKLRYYAEQTGRPYIRMETELLSAIAKDRMGGPWQDELAAAVRGAGEYRFLRVICEEGAAALPLLQRARKELAGDETLDKAWLRFSISASADNARNTASNVPSSRHLANRAYTDCQGPYASGSSRHCAPLRAIQSIPLSIFLSSFRGRPRCPVLSGGSIAFTRSHCSFVNSYRFMFLFSHLRTTCAIFIFQTTPRQADGVTEADRQFLQQQQEIYQDAVEGFYQIAALWTDMCDHQRSALSVPENNWKGNWKKKYLVSKQWPDITAGEIMKHISLLHREFISTVVSYLNDMYHLTLDSYNVENGLLPEEPSYSAYDETLDGSALKPVILRYEDAIELILSWFDGRTFEEQAPYELVERCHQAAWREKDRQANFEQKKNLVKILSGVCSYGFYNGREQWHVNDGGKNILKALAHFETGTFGQYPDGIDDLLSEKGCLWFDLWEFEDCEKLEKIRLFKNGRMDIRFTSEGYAREFVSGYLGTIW